MQKQIKKFQLILGSSSPRRREFFEYLGVPFKIITPDIEEISHEKNAVAYVKDIAAQKAQCVWDKVRDKQSFVVCSDTTVALADEIIGKPKDHDEALQFLAKLEGKTHQVHTAVHCFYGQDQASLSFCETTNVSFGQYDQVLLKDYISTGDSLDKAGAYGAQGMAQIFIKSIEGSYSNVIGFPMSTFLAYLQDRFSSVQSIKGLFK